MNIVYNLIEDDNREDYAGVFPETIELTDNMVAVAACDVDSGYVVGAISYSLVSYEYVIDWIYVEPDFRRKGIGVGLVNEVLRAVMQSGDRFPVIAQYENNSEGESDAEMHLFFLSCDNMTTSYSHDRYYVKAEDIKNVDKLHKTTTSELTTQEFFEQSENDQKKILRMLGATQNYEVIDYDKWKEECIKELCNCVFVKNNLVDLIFMKRLKDMNVELAYLYGKYPKGLLELLSTTVSRLETLYPKASLTFDAMTDESQLLATHLFGKAKKVHIYEAEF